MNDPALKIDAVKMMREIREKHHARYAANPEARRKRLAEIRKKYKMLQKSNRLRTAEQ